MLSITLPDFVQLEDENTVLYAQCEDNNQKQRVADAKTAELLDILDDVRDFPSRYLLILMNG